MDERMPAIARTLTVAMRAKCNGRRQTICQAPPQGKPSRAKNRAECEQIVHGAMPRHAQMAVLALPPLRNLYMPRCNGAVSATGAHCWQEQHAEPVTAAPPTGAGEMLAPWWARAAAVKVCEIGKAFLQPQ